MPKRGRASNKRVLYLRAALDAWYPCVRHKAMQLPSLRRLCLARRRTRVEEATFKRLRLPTYLGDCPAALGWCRWE